MGSRELVITAVAPRCDCAMLGDLCDQIVAETTSGDLATMGVCTPSPTSRLERDCRGELVRSMRRARGPEAEGCENAARQGSWLVQVVSRASVVKKWMRGPGWEGDLHG